jgi:hypothetical protein
MNVKGEIVFILAICPEAETTIAEKGGPSRV